MTSCGVAAGSAATRQHAAEDGGGRGECVQVHGEEAIRQRLAGLGRRTWLVCTGTLMRFEQTVGEREARSEGRMQRVWTGTSRHTGPLCVAHGYKLLLEEPSPFDLASGGGGEAIAQRLPQLSNVGCSKGHNLGVLAAALPKRATPPCRCRRWRAPAPSASRAGHTLLAASQDAVQFHRELMMWRERGLKYTACRVIGCHVAPRAEHT
jgi:hypothetical protein